MIDIKNLKKYDIIKNNEEGFLKNEYGIVNYSTGDIAVVTFIKIPEYPFIVGIWNVNQLELINN